MPALFRRWSFLTCRGSKMRSPSGLHHETFLNEEIHLAHPGISTCLRTCSPARRKVVLASTSSSESARGITRSSTALARPLRLPDEFAPEEGQADIGSAHSALDHDQRFQLRQAAQRMDQDVGQAGHGKPRMPGMPCTRPWATDAGRWHTDARSSGALLRRMQAPTTCSSALPTRRSAGPCSLAGGQVRAGVLRRRIVSAPDPHHGAVGQRPTAVSSCRMNPARAEVSRAGRSAARGQESLQCPLPPLCPVLGSDGDAAGLAYVDKLRCGHVAATFDTDTPPRQPQETPKHGSMCPRRSARPTRSEKPVTANLQPR